jgi:hypothetical protein
VPPPSLPEVQCLDGKLIHGKFNHPRSSGYVVTVVSSCNLFSRAMIQRQEREAPLRSPLGAPCTSSSLLSETFTSTSEH